MVGKCKLKRNSLSFVYICMYTISVIGLGLIGLYENKSQPPRISISVIKIACLEFVQ